MSLTGSAPKSGAIKLSNQRLFPIVTAARPSREAFSRYSSPTSLNVVPALSLAASASACFCAAGSTPLAMSVRASSRRFRASFKVTSGYRPRPSRFSFPPNRYLSRHSFPPEGCIRRNRPPPSKSLLNSSPNFAALIALSVKAILGATFLVDSKWPPKWPPKIGDCPRTAATDGGPLIPVYSGFCGFFQALALENWCPGEDSNLHALASAST